MVNLVLFLKGWKLCLMSGALAFKMLACLPIQKLVLNTSALKSEIILKVKCNFSLLHFTYDITIWFISPWYHRKTCGLCPQFLCSQFLKCLEFPE